MLKNWHLLALFLVAFILFFVAQLPARMVLGWSGFDQRLVHAGVAGTAWDMQLSDVWVDRRLHLGDVHVQHDVFSLAIGQLSAFVRFKSAERSGAFLVEEGEEGRFVLTDLVVAETLKMHTRGVALSGLLSVRSDRLELHPQTGCVKGGLAVKTDMLASLLGEGFVLSGQGRCEGGILMANLDGDDGRLSVNLALRWKGGSDMNAAIEVLPVQQAGISPALGGLLTTAGLKKEGDGWSGKLVFDLT